MSTTLTPSLQSGVAGQARSASRLQSANMSLDRTNRLLSIVIVLALVGVGLGLMLVQRIGTTYRDGLSVTRDGSDVAALSAGTASDLAADVSTLARTAAQGLVETRTIILLAAESVTSIAAQLRDLAASVEASRAALIELQKLSNGVAASVDDALQRSSTDLWLLRLVVIVIGVIVAGAARVAQRAIRAGGGT